MSDKIISFRVELFNSDKKWKKRIDESRFAIIFYCYMWLIQYSQIYNRINPNHVYRNFTSIMLDNNRELFKGLMALEKNLSRVCRSASSFIDTRLYKKYKYNSTLKLGHKLIPLSVADVRNYKNPKYRPWRELYVDYLVGKLVVNMITPGLPVMGEFFFVRDSDHGMFDNDSMHTKLDMSDTGSVIADELEETKKKTISSNGDKMPDDLKYINNRFKSLADKIEASIDFAEEEIVMSGVLMCKIVENIGFTVRDLSLIHI